MTYEESVLDCCDQHGRLSYGDASRLLAVHGFNIGDLYENDHGVSQVAIDERNGAALLAWLGY
jgi:hypothetical protein